MIETEQYFLRWRGRQSGPFSLDEINRKLDAHEIGMGHEIQCDEQWISLDDFFARPQPNAAMTQFPKSSSQSSVGKSAWIGGASKPNISPSDAGEFSANDFTQPRPQSSPKPRSSAQKDQSSAPAKAKRQLVYAGLGIFLGFAGVHNYYARHWMTGLLQLLLSVATLLLGFGIIAPWLWAMVEAFFVRKDGNGQEML